jgi:DNA-binding NtrC family response regulator
MCVHLPQHPPVVRQPTGEIDTDVTGSVQDPGEAELCLLVSAAGTLSSHPLTRAHPIVIGRSRSCDIVIEHPSVSRRHAELTLAPLGVRDLGSSNGTRLRGKRIATEPPTRLEIGDAIQLGDAVVLVQRSPAAASGRAWRGELLDGRLAEECARSARSGQPFGFARVHVDLDADLDVVEEELEAALRATDLFASAGPSQFQLLLVDTPPTGARQVLERIAARLEARGLAPRWSLATWPRDGTTAEQLAAHAWNALRVTGGAMDRIRAVIEQIADSSLSVLIRGETGVGKELCAEMIHRLSRRARRPFVRINCAALTEELLESELFGHERGAFTGAAAAKPGLIETADGGTLFLDEIGDLPRGLQAKLLRVLEDRVVQRVGAVEGRMVDVRFVAATNRVLEADMAGGRFRRDLYFRLGGVTIEIPPLRERLDELDGLVAAFVARAAAAARQPAPAVTEAATAALREHAWPGNVRELRNTIERAVLLCGAGSLDVAHLTLTDIDVDADAISTITAPVERGTDRFSRPTLPALAGGEEGLRGEVAKLEAQRIQDALRACGGNQTRAARTLGISRNTLQARMDAFGIPRPRKPPRSDG